MPCLLLVKVFWGRAATALHVTKAGAPVPAMYPFTVKAEPISVAFTQAAARDPIATRVLAAITLYVVVPCAA